MKSLAFGLLALSLLPAGTALANRHDWPAVTIRSCCDEPTRWADRWDRGESRMAITTEDGGVDLLIAGNVVAMQLSDRKMREVRRKLYDKENEDDDNPLARAIKVAVLGGVRSMLDHSIECPIRELRTVDYRSGRLVIITNDGDRLFEGVDVDDRDVLESFSDHDARAFVAAFQREKARR